MDRFVELLAALPQSQSVPPGMQNLQSLVWQYYYEKLSTLQHGTVHYFATLVSSQRNIIKEPYIYRKPAWLSFPGHRCTRRFEAFKPWMTVS